MLSQAKLTSIFLIVQATVIRTEAGSNDLSPDSIYKVHGLFDVFGISDICQPSVCLCMCLRL